MKSILFKLFIYIFVLAIPTEFVFGQEKRSWEIDSPIFENGTIGTFDEISVKDPTIVFFENAWHLFYTARGNNEYTTAYASAKDLDSLNNASRFELKTNVKATYQEKIN